MPYVKGIGGMALGTGLGYGGMELLNRYALKNRIPYGSPLAHVLPLAGTISGLAVSGLQDRMFNQAKKNWEARAQERATNASEDS